MHNSTPQLASGTLSRRSFLGVAALAVAANGGCGGNDEKPPEPASPEKPKPPIITPSLGVLTDDWSAGGAVNWKVAAVMAAISKEIYLFPEEAVIAIKSLGFEKVSPFTVASMAGVVATTQDVTVVAFRGTDELEDWVANLDMRSRNVPGGKIHAGFYKAYVSLQSSIREAIENANKDHVWVTGHSLGGALAVVCGYDLTREVGIPVKGVITFGQPMVAKEDLADKLTELLDDKHQRYVNGSDIVTRIPPRYVHSGEPVWFSEDGIIREPLRQFGAPSQGMEPTGDDPLPPLSEAEFEQLKADLRRTENVDEVETRELRTFGGNLPWLRDHGMELYIEKIDLQQSKLPD